MRSIGRYLILGELGRGAMGVVYRAQDPAIGREVAIKTIRLSELADGAERQRLRDRLFREAQSAGILSHPNIVTIYDVAEEGDLAYIAMECVNGPTLDRQMATDPPEGTLVLSLLSQTAAALDYAHRRGIVHRDIKPANIMIHEAQIAKITDFGVARLPSHQMTQAGSMVGTPNYMSPEQIQGQPVDGRSDQFSLAVIAYELLAGEKPFVADSIAALAYRIVREQPREVHRLNPTLDWPVNTVIQRALAKLPADRYPTCSDFAFALENACRTCRKWRPLPQGGAHDLATVAVPVPTPETVAPVSSPPQYSAPELPASRPAPAFLRALRGLTILLLSGGLLAAFVLAGLRYFDGRREPATPTASAPEPPPPDRTGPAPRKPSAVPQPERPGEVAGGPASPEPPVPSLPEQDQLPTDRRGTAPSRAGAGGETEPATKGGESGSSIRLVTNPPGAFLVIDGVSQFSCQSPCSLTLPRGRHTLAATLENHRRTLRILEVPRDNEVFLNLDRASGTVMVRSEPRGADIILNGKTRPEKTPAMLTLPAGRYTLELAVDGRREAQEVQVRDSGITNVAITFPR